MQAMDGDRLAGIYTAPPETPGRAGSYGPPLPGVKCRLAQAVQASELWIKEYSANTDHILRWDWLHYPTDLSLLLVTPPACQV